MDAKAGCENLLAELVLQKRHAARHSRAGNAAEEGAEDASGQTVLENHRRFLAGDLARAEAPRCALAGAAAKLFGAGQIGEEAFGAPLIVALHILAALGDGLGAERIGGPALAALEAVGRGVHKMRRFAR